jgi:hexokinase
MAKEVEISGMVGEKLGAGINAALARAGLAPKRVRVLNDTTAAMLGGGGQIGFILGTGTNTCYAENIREITKIASNSDGRMVVNIESGCYAGFPRGVYDEELDANSKTPGDHMAEKLIGGAYLGDALTLTLAGAADEHILPAPRRAYTARDMTEFFDGIGALWEDYADDRTNVQSIIENFFDRAARLTAIMFAAILTQMGEGHDPAKPVTISAEGTTFEKSDYYRARLAAYMDGYVRDELRFYTRIVTTENSTIVGTAKAVL